MENEKITFLMPELKFNIKTIYPKAGWRGIHFHNAVELISANDGELMCDICGNKVILGSDNILIINRGNPHRIENISASCVTYIQADIPLKASENAYIYDFMLRTEAKAFEIFDTKSEPYDIFHLIKKEFEEKKPYYEMYIKSHIYRLQAFLYRCNMLSNRGAEAISGLEKIIPLTAFIEKNYMTHLSLNILAKESKYGKFELCRIFKKITGSTIVEYINYLRIKKSEELLLQNEKNVTEIGMECGFSSVQYFNKVFKDHVGCSPSNYRKYLYSTE